MHLCIPFCLLAALVLLFFPCGSVQNLNFWLVAVANGRIRVQSPGVKAQPGQFIIHTPSSAILSTHQHSRPSPTPAHSGYCAFFGMDIYLIFSGGFFFSLFSFVCHRCYIAITFIFCM